MAYSAQQLDGLVDLLVEAVLREMEAESENPNLDGDAPTENGAKPWQAAPLKHADEVNPHDAQSLPISTAPRAT